MSNVPEKKQETTCFLQSLRLEGSATRDTFPRTGPSSCPGAYGLGLRGLARLRLPAPAGRGPLSAGFAALPHSGCNEESAST